MAQSSSWPRPSSASDLIEPDSPPAPDASYPFRHMRSPGDQVRHDGGAERSGLSIGQHMGQLNIGRVVKT
jgi:hypothetical protein